MFKNISFIIYWDKSVHPVTILKIKKKLNASKIISLLEQVI
jgi:hypothetical protein